MTPYSGMASVTPGFATSTKIDLNQIGEARNSMMKIKLDQVRAHCIAVDPLEKYSSPCNKTLNLCV